MYIILHISYYILSGTTTDREEHEEEDAILVEKLDAQTDTETNSSHSDENGAIFLEIVQPEENVFPDNTHVADLVALMMFLHLMLLLKMLFFLLLTTLLKTLFTTLLTITIKTKRLNVHRQKEVEEELVEEVGESKIINQKVQTNIFFFAKLGCA